MTNIDELISRATWLGNDVQRGKDKLYNAGQYSKGCLLRDAGQLLEVVNALLHRAADPEAEVKP